GYASTLAKLTQDAIKKVMPKACEVRSLLRRLKEATPIIHAAALRSWGKELPWAWPRDGRRETLEGAGVALAQQYKVQGLNMLHQHAQFEDGSVSVEAGLMAMLTRMQMGKLKVFSTSMTGSKNFASITARMARLSKRVTI